MKKGELSCAGPEEMKNSRETAKQGRKVKWICEKSLTCDANEGTGFDTAAMTRRGGDLNAGQGWEQRWRRVAMFCRQRVGKD